MRVWGFWTPPGRRLTAVMATAVATVAIAAGLCSPASAASDRPSGPAGTRVMLARVTETAQVKVGGGSGAASSEAAAAASVSTSSFENYWLVTSSGAITAIGRAKKFSLPKTKLSGPQRDGGIPGVAGAPGDLQRLVQVPAGVPVAERGGRACARPGTCIGWMPAVARRAGHSPGLAMALTSQHCAGTVAAQRDA